MLGRTVTLRYNGKLFLARYIVFDAYVIILLPDNSRRVLSFLPLQADRVVQLELLKFARNYLIGDGD